MNTSVNPTTAPPSPVFKKGISWLLIIAGALLILIPLMQAYIGLRPWLVLVDFLPMEMILSDIVSMIPFAHGAIVAGICLFTSGILLVLHRRLGWTLAMAMLIVTVFGTLEAVGMFLYGLWKDPEMAEMTIAFAWEFLELTYYLPIIAMLFQVSIMIVLLLPTTRLRLTVQKSQFWWAVGIALFMVIEQHLFLFFYLLYD